MQSSVYGWYYLLFFLLFILFMVSIELKVKGYMKEAVIMCQSDKGYIWTGDLSYSKQNMQNRRRTKYRLGICWFTEHFICKCQNNNILHDCTNQKLVLDLFSTDLLSFVWQLVFGILSTIDCFGFKNWEGQPLAGHQVQSVGDLFNYSLRPTENRITFSVGIEGGGVSLNLLWN